MWVTLNVHSPPPTSSIFFVFIEVCHCYCLKSCLLKDINYEFYIIGFMLNTMIMHVHTLSFFTVGWSGTSLKRSNYFCGLCFMLLVILWIVCNIDFCVEKIFYKFISHIYCLYWLVYFVLYLKRKNVSYLFLHKTFLTWKRIVSCLHIWYIFVIFVCF